MAESVFEQLVKATDELLGPASERFIERQIDNHLRKAPQELTSEDVAALSGWIRAALGCLTDDRRLLRNYDKELKKLGRGV